MVPKHQSTRFRKSSSDTELLARCIDCIAIAGLLLAFAWYYLREWPDGYFSVLLISLAVYFWSAQAVGLYRSVRGIPLLHVSNLMLTAWACVVGVLLLLGYLLKVTADFSRVVFTAWLIVTPLVLLAWRSGLQYALIQSGVKPSISKSALIVGVDDAAASFYELLTHETTVNYSISGFIDARPATSLNSISVNDNLILGYLSDLSEIVENKKIDVVYITVAMNEETVISAALEVLSHSSTSVFLVPDLGLLQLRNSEWVFLGDQPMISVMDTPLHGVNSGLKRLEDLVIGALGICFCVIPMMIIALAIKIDSKGPVFFTQKRHGRKGNEILLFKFRTMAHQPGESEFVQATRFDPRITAVGRFLRRFSFDELPQLFNVLRGDMSIVGPRPHELSHHEELRGSISGYMMRYMVKPGMTGWAQVHGFRGQTDTAEKKEGRIKYDLEYINHWSLWLDLLIILKTPVAVIRGTNAH